MRKGYPLFMVNFLLYSLTLGLNLAGCDEDRDEHQTAMDIDDSMQNNEVINNEDETVIEEMTQIDEMSAVVPVDGPLYHYRYCEILLPQIVDGEVHAEIWGTQAVNTCPQELWNQLDAEAIAAEYGVLGAIMNGPRYFVVDLSTGELPENQEMNRFFGELEMQYLTTVQLSISELMSNSPYQSVEVDRSNVWHFNRGRRVYELTDPEGTKYIMQSYSNIIDKNLSLEDLETLNERLSLPIGWSYTTRILEEDFQARNPEGKASVIQDEFSNTYQRLP